MYTKKGNHTSKIYTSGLVTEYLYKKHNASLQSRRYFPTISHFDLTTSQELYYSDLTFFSEVQIIEIIIYKTNIWTIYRPEYRWELARVSEIQK